MEERYVSHCEAFTALNNLSSCPGYGRRSRVGQRCSHPTRAVLAQSSQRQSPLAQGLQSCTLHPGHPWLIQQQGCSQLSLQMATPWALGMVHPMDLCWGRIFSHGAWFLPYGWSVPLICTGINCTYAPYAQGPRSWLSFCFILVAFLQPSPA